MAASQTQTNLADPVLDAQSVFRTLLTAMSRPGEPQDLGVDIEPAMPLSHAACAVLLTLADLDSPVWLDAGANSEPVRHLLRYGCARSLAESPSEASFAVLTDLEKTPNLSAFCLGTDEYPDRSATLIVDVAAFQTQGAILSGPGIESQRTFGFSPCPNSFWAQVLDNHEQYPRGVDLILCSGRSLAALPRSTCPSDF